MNPSGNQLVGMSKIGMWNWSFPHDITSKYVPFHMIDVIYASNQSGKTTQNWQKKSGALDWPMYVQNRGKMRMEKNVICQSLTSSHNRL